MKLKPAKDNDGQVRGWEFYCPGCEHLHVFYVAGRLIWEFDGNPIAPTFTPSLLNTCEKHPDPTQRRCHLNLTVGKLYFHADCSHALAGQCVDLVDIPEDRFGGGEA